VLDVWLAHPSVCIPPATDLFGGIVQPQNDIIRGGGTREILLPVFKGGVLEAHAILNHLGPYGSYLPEEHEKNNGQVTDLFVAKFNYLYMDLYMLQVKTKKRSICSLLHLVASLQYNT
jgi:hypothetical protein